MKDRRDPAATSRSIHPRIEPKQSAKPARRADKRRAGTVVAEHQLSERDVGYCKPPRSSQFRPGVSGNPNGRPKGTRNLATDLAAELGEQIAVRENGRLRQISKQRALIKSLMAKALEGDVRASAAVLALYARVISEPPEDEGRPIDDDELLIIRRFGPRLLKSLGKKGTKS